MENLLIFYYSAVNVFAFFLMGYDKQMAKKKKRRISENHLLLSAFLGGAFGSLLGMNLFHHKTKKRKFQILVPIALVCHLLPWLYFFLF